MAALGKVTAPGHPASRHSPALHCSNLGGTCRRSVPGTKRLAKKGKNKEAGMGPEKQGVGSSPITMVCQDLLTPTPTRSTYADLRRHVHEQHSSHWGLGLTVALVRPVDGIGLQDSVQVLLPKGSAEDGNHQTFPCLWTRTLLQVPS